MKLYNNKRNAIIIFSIICGLSFTAYILYEKRGTIGLTEIIVLTFTAIITVLISLIILKKGTK